MSDRLPSGWVERESKSHSGRSYYYNTKTGESSWTRPSGSGSGGSGSGSGGAPSKVRASHILVKHRDSRRPSSWKEETVTRSRDEARAAIQVIRARLVAADDLPTEFADIARVESHCSSAERGGDLGSFGREEMQKEFSDVAFALQVGELSQPVDTASGVHVILRTA
eukprot:TRINITY_DN343_c1_g1_i1.p1 TRINITY_DN343_c1_g1~~TRINITY_DN343_c1_g1_i1.p1  ORF type:complete len:178 (-),score=28.78 TRINITY_DN343_c1_g1_i1:66-566(-)